MTRGEAAEVDREARAAFPALNQLGATLIPERHAAALGIGPPPAPGLDKLRSDLVTVVREIGLVQTGRGVDMLWVRNAINTLAEASMGVTDFDFVTESGEDALERVVLAAREQLKADRSSTTRRNTHDSPF